MDFAAWCVDVASSLRELASRYARLRSQLQARDEELHMLRSEAAEVAAVSVPDVMVIPGPSIPSSTWWRARQFVANIWLIPVVPEVALPPNAEHNSDDMSCGCSDEEVTSLREAVEAGASHITVRHGGGFAIGENIAILATNGSSEVVTIVLIRNDTMSRRWSAITRLVPWSLIPV